MTRQHHDLEVLLPRWSLETDSSIASWGEFTPTLEDVSRIGLLPLFGKVNSMWIVLEEENQSEAEVLDSTNEYFKFI